MRQRGQSGDGCVEASILYRYDRRKGDLFVFSWARVRRVCIFLLPFFHFFTLLPFFPLLPFLSILLFQSFPSCPLPYFSSFPFYPSFFSCLSVPSNLSVSSYLFFPTPPLLSLRSLHSLLTSFPSNPIFLSYSSIYPTSSLLYSIIFPTPPFLPIPRFPPFLPTPPFIPVPPFHHILLFLLTPPSFHPFLFLISLLPLFATFPSSVSFLFSASSLHPFLSHLSFPSYPSILFYPISIPSYPSFPCLSPSLRLTLLFATAAFILNSSSIPRLLSLSHPLFPFYSSSPSSLTFPLSYHSLRLPFTTLLRSPPFSFSILAPSLSLSLFPFLSLSPSISPYRTLSFSLLQFSPSLLLSFFSLLPPPYLLPPPSPSLFYFSLSHIIVLCSKHNTLIYNSTY